MTRPSKYLSVFSWEKLFYIFCIIFSIYLMFISLKYYKIQTKHWEIYIGIHVLCFIWLEWLWRWYEMTFYLGCKFQTCSQWKNSKFRPLIDVILNFYALHNSVWGDLWPYSNAYVRPGTRATQGRIVSFHKKDWLSMFIKLPLIKQTFMIIIIHKEINWDIL